MDHLEAWRIVRSEILNRLASEIAAAREPSVWYTESMQSGDVSELGAMLENVEALLGIPESERTDWTDDIWAMEKAGGDE